MASPLNSPELSDREQAEKLLDSLKNACPWHTTFLFLEPGCDQVGQGTELARSIEQAMKKSFDLWANSWIRPHLEDLVNRAGAQLKAEPGDYIRTDGQTLRITSLDLDNREYNMEDGSVLSDDQITYDMVLLPSEALV